MEQESQEPQLTRAKEALGLATRRERIEGLMGTVLDS